MEICGCWEPNRASISGKDRSGFMAKCGGVPCTEEGFLGKVFGILAMAGKGKQERKNPAMMAVDELPECRRRPPLGLAGEEGVVIG